MADLRDPVIRQVPSLVQNAYMCKLRPKALFAAYNLILQSFFGVNAARAHPSQNRRSGPIHCQIADQDWRAGRAAIRLAHYGHTLAHFT